jgi:hypothetical protein
MTNRFLLLYDRSIQKFSVHDALKQTAGNDQSLSAQAANNVNGSLGENATSLNASPALNTYAKYVKFEMLSHYGNEHYCPLSLVRVYGTNFVDDDDNSVMDQQSGHFEEPVQVKVDMSTNKDLTNASAKLDSNTSFIIVDNEKFNDSLKRTMKKSFLNNLISVFLSYNYALPLMFEKHYVDHLFNYYSSNDRVSFNHVSLERPKKSTRILDNKSLINQTKRKGGSIANDNLDVGSKLLQSNLTSTPIQFEFISDGKSETLNTSKNLAHLLQIDIHKM